MMHIILYNNYIIIKTTELILVENNIYILDGHTSKLHENCQNNTSRTANTVFYDT